MNSLTRKLAIFVALVALALAATPAAFAQSSRDGYINPGGTINERVQGGDPASETRSDSGSDSSSSPGATSSNNGGSDGSGNGDGDSTLPFTGSDLGLLAGGGLLLLGLGVGMRRLTRPNVA